MTNGTDTLTEKTPTIKLWNPTALNWWSLLTPIFSAWFHAKNWDELGQPEKAKTTRIWFYGLIAFVSAFVIFVPDDFTNGSSIGILTTIVYYIVIGRKQTLYIRDNNIEYEKKSLLKPLTIMFTIIIVLFALVFSTMSEDYVENTYQETTSANATNDRSATCSDTEVTELVLETTRETVIEQKGELASNQINIRLFDIRTVGHNEKLGSKECEAEVEFSGEGIDNTVITATYDIEFVDNSTEFYVTTYISDYIFETPQERAVSDMIKKFNIAKESGNSVQICVYAQFVAAAQLQANNSDEYKQWLEVVKNYCY